MPWLGHNPGLPSQRIGERGRRNLLAAEDVFVDTRKLETISAGFAAFSWSARVHPTNKKAAPFGATLFKEAKWRVSEENHWTPVRGVERTGGEMAQTSRVKLFQRCGLFSTHEMSICGTKMVSGEKRQPHFGNLFKIKALG